MAAALNCHMTALTAAPSHHRVGTLNPSRTAVVASTAASSGAFSSRKLRAAGAVSRSGLRWGCRSSRCSGRFAVSAAVEAAAVSANEADSGAPAENLAMHFKAEGTLNENAVSKVVKALEGIEGVSQVKVHVDEGAATITLVKLTNIQATGVASGLVETIEQAGFKMQALSLGFDDDDAEDDDYIDYDASTYVEAEEATAE